MTDKELTELRTTLDGLQSELVEAVLFMKELGRLLREMRECVLTKRVVVASEGGQPLVELGGGENGGSLAISNTAGAMVITASVDDARGAVLGLGDAAGRLRLSLTTEGAGEVAAFSDTGEACKFGPPPESNRGRAGGR